MQDQPLRRYLEASRLPAGSPFHTSQVSISFGESIDATSLRKAWDAIAAAAPALRSTFNANDDLVEAGATEPAWRELDWQASPPDDLGAEWQSLVQTDAAAPIASATEPPCRITLITLPNGDGHALWSFHGASLDDASISIVLQRWLHAYDCVRTGEQVPEFESADAGESEDPAPEAIAPPRPLIVLPLPEPDAPEGVRRSISHTFERPERAELVSAAESLGGDLRALLGSAWAFVLARAATSDDAILLEPERSGAGIGRLETFRLRRRSVAPHATSADLVKAFAADAPEVTVDFGAKSKGQNAKSSVLPAFIYREHTLNDRLILAMPRWMAADTQLFQTTPTPITLRAVASDRPEVALDYDPACISDTAARTLFDAFRGTLTAFAADPTLVLETFAVPGARAEVESAEAPTPFRSLVAEAIHEMFADAAAESPDSVAVEMGEEKLTFAQLNAQANQLARLLRKRGVPAGARVGIAMARSPRWVAALLGTLKAGAAIVPLCPGEKDADVRGWIVDTLEEGEERTAPVIQMQSEAGSIAHEKSRGVQGDTQPNSEALAVTAADGMQVFNHKELAAALQSFAGLLALSPADRVLQFAPTDRLTAVEETLATLLSGATLVLRGEERWTTRTAFQEFVQEHGITALEVPTPFWSQWTHYLTELSLRTPATLRLAVTAGTLPSPNITAAWHSVAGDTRWIHRTVSTATGLGLSAEARTDDPCASACLGTPTPATIARLVDSRSLTVPVGFTGKVEVASSKTSEKFTSLDLEAFLLPDGTFYERSALELLAAGPSGDAEALAIRYAASIHPEVLDAYAEKQLIAARNEWCLWIVPRDSERGEPHDFRDWLAERLPAVPRRVRALPRFPLDEAGCIDFTALRALVPDDVAASSVRKGSDAEERLRQAISRALGGRRIELDEIIADGRTKPPLAKRLFEAVSREEPRVELADFTTGFSVHSLLRNVRGRKSSDTDSKWTPVQPLRASGKLPPLIFIHDLDGTAKPYAGLVAHLGDDQPCYAITARGLTDPDACHSSVEEMAQAYVQALRVFDANGPYRLLGYGLGGLVAFEMGRQLAAAGAEIPLLVALATEPPANNSPVGFLAGGWKRALPAMFGRKSGEETNARRRRTQDTPVFRACQEAARKYSVTSAAPLSAHVFAPERDFPSCQSIQSGWSGCCREVHLYQVPCSGPEMMDEPAVESVAHALSKLARAEELGNELES